MKKLLFMAGVFSMLNASAQYSQWTYGMGNPGETEQASNGQILRSTGHGHIMAGPHNSIMGRMAYVVKSDPNGKSMATPYFNNNYLIVHPSGVALEVRECKVTEFQNGSGYGVAGIYDNPSSGRPGLFYMWLDKIGNVVADPFIYESTTSGFSITDITFGNIRENVMGTELYLVGGISLSNGGGWARWHSFIHKIDYNGNVIWSNIYAMDRPTQAFDAVEEPSGSQLAVVGVIERDYSSDAFFYRVDPSNGNPIPIGVTEIYGNNGSKDELHSICYSSTTGGWMVCGRSTQNTMGGDYDAWVMSLDMAGNVLWSQLSNGNSTVPADNEANQIIERRNYSGMYEFYTSGTMDNGPFGGRDVQVFKGDINSGIFSAHFAYGGPQDDYGFGLDANNMPGNPDEGLAVFGSTESFSMLGGFRNNYFIKAYFNGMSGCNEDINTPFSYGGPVELTRLDYIPYDDMVGYTGFAKIINGKEDVLCLNYTVPGGDNSLKAKVKGQDLETQGSVIAGQSVVISPNPVEQGVSNLQLNVTAPAGTIEVIVADYMGREYINQHFDIREGGEQILSLELGRAGLAPGLYLLKVIGLDKPAAQALIVK